MDEHSDASEFDMVAIQALIAEVALGTATPISSRDLAGRALPHLHIYGTKYRNRLIGMVEQALERLCAANPRNFQFRGPTATRDYSLVEVSDSPERADPRGRTQRYQAIQRRSQGHPLDEPTGMSQMALFDNIDLGAELEEPELDESSATWGDSKESGA